MATCIKSRSVSRDTFNTALETCMASELSGKTGGKEKYEARRKCYKSTSVQTELKKLQVSYRSARKVCSNSTKTSYLKVGGKSDKFVREKKKAAVSELKTALKSCVEEKMLEKNVTSLSKELRMEIAPVFLLLIEILLLHRCLFSYYNQMIRLSLPNHHL
jgi:predicted AAA+ superfamily ATPase